MGYKDCDEVLLQETDDDLSLLFEDEGSLMPSDTASMGMHEAIQQAPSSAKRHKPRKRMTAAQKELIKQKRLQRAEKKKLEAFYQRREDGFKAVRLNERPLAIDD